MAKSNDWLPSRLPEQATVFENINNKIDNYVPPLSLTSAQIATIHKICIEFDTAYTFTEQCRATVMSIVDWRDLVLKGEPVGSPAPQPPVFPTTNLPASPTIGIIRQFRELRDIILADPAYTDTIGQDLMIIAAAGSSPNVPAHEATPELKVQVGSGYEINVAGPMHGMDAMRVEYLRNNDGNVWNLVGFLTKTPGVVTISPHVPGEPEAGRIRARYIQNNVPVGNYSQEAAVTVSA